MSRSSRLTFALLFIAAFGLQNVAAQITIRIPDVKIRKPKAERPPAGQPTGQPAGEISGDEAPPNDDDIYTNRNAPPDYDPNLKVNDLAVAAVLSSLEPVRITGKSGGAYRAVTLDSRGVTLWVKANSVYPYFDTREFDTIRVGNERFITPYFRCYAKKHNLELDKFAGASYSEASYDSAQHLRAALEADLPKLAELSAQLRGKLQARPQTFLDYGNNPAIWDEIAANRDEYLRCAVAEKESRRFSESGWLRAHLDGIGKSRKEVDEYHPSEKIYLVGGSGGEYLLYAVSPRARDRWLKGANALDFKPALDPELDALAAAAAKKLPLYKPKPSLFGFRNPVEERMMRSKLNNLATLKVNSIGLAQANWLIAKNDFGIPTARYKQGYIWARDGADDHPYCHLYQVNIIQDYAGGGTYGASYARFIDDTLIGCP